MIMGVMEMNNKQICGSCIWYLTDFRHDRNKPTGFCAIQPLFTERKQGAKPCADYVYDKED